MTKLNMLSMTGRVKHNITTDNVWRAMKSLFCKVIDNKMLYALPIKPC